MRIPENINALWLQTALKRKRLQLGLTQKQAAAESGISYGTYVQAETYGRMGTRVASRVTTWLNKGNAVRPKMYRRRGTTQTT